MKIFKNRLLQFFCLLLITTVAPSCKKWLDLKPQDGIIRQNFWKTKEQVSAAVTGCYASLLGAPAGVSDRPLAEYFFLWGELRSDMLAVYPGGSISNDEIDIMNVNILSTNPITNWRSVYRTINYCNTVIAFAPDVLANDKTFSQEALNAAVGEAKTIRALMYFYLVRTFRDVPLVLTATSSDEQLQQLPKNTSAEVLDQIVKDLTEVENALPLNYASQAESKGRITRYALNALQADIYLWMEKYPEAIAACDKVINSSKFGLVPGTASWFNTLYVNGNSTESIFEFQFDRQKLNSFYGIFRTRPRFQASATVVDEFFNSDGVNDLFDIRYDGGSVRANDGLIWKYIGIDNNTLRAAEESFAHWFVYRYPDVLLMKAEALAVSVRGQEALDLIDRVRQRAHAIPATQRTVLATDTDAILDYILEERGREFAFEGKRWYDLLRFAKRSNYKRLDLITNMVSKTVPADRQQSAIAKYKDFNSHYLPIYQYELQTDKNLVQNPFYK
jgi:hypothetical protein